MPATVLVTEPLTDLNSVRTLVGRHRIGPSNLHFVTVDKVDRRIKNHLIALLDPGVHFHLSAEIAGHCHLADLRFSVIDNRHLQAVAVEDDGVGGHDERH
jgi:hypothetical protein